MEIYKGRELKANEWLLKVKEDKTAFMTRLTGKGLVPVNFNQWRDGYKAGDLDVFIHEENYSKGWSIDFDRFYGYARIGKSQQWIKVTHPLGFVLEIRLENFLNKVVPFMVNGEMTGKWAWIGSEIERSNEII